MITQNADNRDLLISAKYSYLNDNYSSGVSSLVITNSSGFTTDLGDSTTQFDITKDGTTIHYKWDETGTNPNIYSSMGIGTSIVIAAQNFDANNNGTFTVTKIGTDYFEVVNAAGVAEDDKTIGTGSIRVAKSIILSNFGSETAELVTVNSVATATHTLTLSAATKFAHSESTKVTILKYNQVKFYHTTTAAYVGSIANSTLIETVDLQADNFYTKVYDVTNTTGFGWFIFYNGTTAKATQTSNAIPYAGFGESYVKSILDSFFSLLNNKELKLVSNDDAFEWLNEAYAIAQNELNLVNKEYTASAAEDISVVSGTKEYDLDDTFGDMISLYNGTDNIYITEIPLNEVAGWDSETGNSLRYYLRGSKIGFSPTPTSAITLTNRYLKKTSKITSYYDEIEMPDNNFYCLKDYMLFRAAPKLNKGDGKSYYDLFMASIERMKMTSIKRGSSCDSWGISPEANV